VNSNTLLSLSYLGKNVIGLTIACDVTAADLWSAANSHTVAGVVPAPLKHSARPEPFRAAQIPWGSPKADRPWENESPHMNAGIPERRPATEEISGLIERVTFRPWTATLEPLLLWYILYEINCHNHSRARMGSVVLHQAFATSGSGLSITA
jgi:hypothetical protein